MSEKEESPIKRALDWIFDAWWLDATFAALLFVGAQLYPERLTWVDILGRLDLQRRIESYADLISISSLLAGFTSLAFATYLGWHSRGISRVKGVVGKKLLPVWIAGIATPWVGAILVWIAKVSDEGKAGEGNFARWLAISAFLMVILSLVRTMIIFLSLAKLDEENPQAIKRSSKPLKISAHRTAPRAREVDQEQSAQ
jgi:hypothetical protein